MQQARRHLAAESSQVALVNLTCVQRCQTMAPVMYPVEQGESVPLSARTLPSAYPSKEQKRAVSLLDATGRVHVRYLLRLLWVCQFPCVSSISMFRFIYVSDAQD